MMTQYIYTRDFADLNTKLTNHFVACPTCGKPRSQVGIERVEIPNPIITTPGVPATPPAIGWATPPVMDVGRLFMVKFTDLSEAEETAGEVQDDRPIWDRTRWGKWVKANSSAVTLAGNTAAGAFSIEARKITGLPHWLLRPSTAAPVFGGWQ